VFGHAYLLTGQDAQYQYDLTFHMAQLLNCESPYEDETGDLQPCETCRSCKWIASNSHPIIKVMSRLTCEDEESFKTKPKDRDRQKIATAQVKSLQHYLARQVGVHESRFIIFTDVEKLPNSEDAQARGVYPTPFEWRQEPKNDGFTLEWKPITSDVFSEASANRFLKCLEEPNPRTHYFFLTRNTESLLPTIVSRCQSVYVPRVYREDGGESVDTCPAELQTWLTQAFHQHNPLQEQALTQDFLAIATNHFLSPLQMIHLVQRQLKAPVFRGDLKRYMQWQTALFKAEETLNASCNPALAIWGMLDDLSA
jgi:hypothetical protein